MQSSARRVRCLIMKWNLEELEDDMKEIEMKKENIKYEIVKKEHLKKRFMVNSNDFKAKVKAIERDFERQKMEAVEKLRKETESKAKEMKEEIESLQQKEDEASEVEKLAVLGLSKIGLHDVDEIHKEAMEVYEQKTPKKTTASGFRRSKF